jgi:hypothetical protein
MIIFRLSSGVHLRREQAMSKDTIRDRSSSYDGSSDGEDEQARLLQLLNSQCAASLGAVNPVASTSRLEDESSDTSDADEEMMEDEDEDEDEEWAGIDHDTLAISMVRQPVVVAFNDGRRGGRSLDIAMSGEKDNFMVSVLPHTVIAVFHPVTDMTSQSTKIRNKNVLPVDALSSRRKGKGKADNDDEDEKHLKQLDSSLYSLVQDLPSNATSASNTLLLSKLDALPSPRLLTRKSQENEKVIDKHAPRTLHEKIYTARLKRAKIADAEARENGVVTAAGKGKYALTKKARREQLGVEDKRRKNAKGITGVVGKMRKGGAVLTLNKEEIRRGNEGDFGGINKRKRKMIPKMGRK